MAKIAGMKTRQLGPFEVSAIGLGCMNLSHAYGPPVSREQGERVLLSALDAGVTFFDTAALYGFGANETLVGQVLKPHRQRFVLASKCGMQGVDRGDGTQVRVIDGRPATLRQTCEDALRRLQTEVIDLYYLHRWDKQVPIEDSVGALSDLVRAGKIQTIGLSEVSASTLRKAHAVHPITAVQTEYSLWTRNPEIAVLQACRELGVAFVAFSPVARGFLCGPLDIAGFDAKDIRRTMPRFAPDNYAANLKLLPAYNALAQEAGCSPSQLALAWLLHKGEDIIPIPGLSSIPIIGPMFFNQTIIVYTMYVLIATVTFALFRTRWGLRTRAVGENPKAADSLGVSVAKVRYLAVIYGGMVGGFAGAWFTLGTVGRFDEGLTGGRGFIGALERLEVLGVLQDVFEQGIELVVAIELAQEVTQLLAIPTIGIGGGAPSAERAQRWSSRAGPRHGSGRLPREAVRPSRTARAAAGDRAGAEMSNAIAVLNAGSSSLKFSLFAAAGEALDAVASGQVEALYTAPHFVAKDAAGKRLDDQRWDRSLGHEGALAHILDWLKAHHGEGGRLAAVGHRVVHGGTEFAAPVRLDAAIVERLQKFVPLAPLHQPHNLAGIRAFARAFPQLPQIAMRHDQRKLSVPSR